MCKMGEWICICDFDDFDAFSLMIIRIASKNYSIPRLFLTINRVASKILPTPHLSLTITRSDQWIPCLHYFLTYPGRFILIAAASSTDRGDFPLIAISLKNSRPLRLDTLKYFKSYKISICQSFDIQLVIIWRNDWPCFCKHIIKKQS